MKFAEALKIIEGGFMVHFEHAGDGFLRSDHFPDKHSGEKLIETEAEAWKLAKRFANNTFGKCVNIYVTKSDFVPVDNYREKMIINR